MKKLFLSILIFSVIALDLSALGQSDYPVNKSSLFLETELSKVAVEMNKKLPMMVDKITRLDKVIVNKNRVTYEYTIVSYSKSDFAGKMDTLFNGLKVNVRNSVCTNKSTKFLLSMGAILHYSYNDKNGAYLSSFTISNSDCRK